MIETLIDKLDNIEIIRDQVAAIIVTELANQRVLAVAAGKDPLLWTIRTFVERANPWEQYLNQGAVPELPIVNIWIDSENFDKSASDIMQRQRTNGIINIDCYGAGLTADEIGPGHKPGDRTAAFEVQRAMRLIRNILMAATYTYLDLQGTVSGRWPQSITYFQPEIDNVAVANVNGARMALAVDFNEFSPQVAGEAIELITIDVHRIEDGEIVAEADYVYPLT